MYLLKELNTQREMVKEFVGFEEDCKKELENWIAAYPGQVERVGENVAKCSNGTVYVYLKIGRDN